MRASGRRWPGPRALLLTGALLVLGAATLAACAGLAASLPDLRVAVAPAAGAVDAGPLALKITLTNSGDAPSSNVTVALSVDGNPTDPPLEFAALTAGGSSTQELAFALPCGYHSVSAEADPGGLVAESDESNNNATATAKVVPAALFNWTLTGPLGTINATLNASASHGCAPLTFAWDIDGVGPRSGVNTTFGAPAGNITVLLTAASAADATLSSTAVQVIEVPNHPPSVELQVVSPIATGVKLTVTVFGSDLDGTVVAYLVDFGDGNSTAVPGNFSQHKFVQPGTYAVTARVWDNLNATGEASASVEVLNRPPEVRVDPPYWYGEAATAVVLSATGSRDPEGGPLTFEWQFGDGVSASGPTVSHVYADSASYEVRLKVTDERGASSNVTVSVVVLPRTASSGRDNLGTATFLAALAVFTVVYIASGRRRRGPPPAPPRGAPPP